MEGTGRIVGFSKYFADYFIFFTKASLNPYDLNFSSTLPYSSKVSGPTRILYAEPVWTRANGYLLYSLNMSSILAVLPRVAICT